jgi:serine beta-lactamase-like protein LACTB
MLRLFSILLAIASLSAQTHYAITPEKIRQIETVITSEMARQSIPGMSIAIGSGTEIWSNGYGMADLENFVPAKTGTVFRTASIAKPMTAVAVLQLAEKRKIDLDAPIQQYLTDFPQKGQRVTARELLGHLGGIRHYRDDSEAFSTKHYWDLREALKQFESDPLAIEPGTKMIYSTFGYVLLGALIEKVSGSNYVEYMRKNIFDIAGMTSTQSDDVYALIPNRSRGYSKSKEGKISNAALHDTSGKIPAGGLVSTAADLVRFAQAVDEGKLLKTETMEQMWTPQRTRDGKPTGYGLGWGVGQFADKKRVGHMGGQAGVSTLFFNFPQEKVTLALMFNLEQVETGAIADRVQEIVFEIAPLTR